jgi:2'-5' RNA ligase
MPAKKKAVSKSEEAPIRAFVALDLDTLSLRRMARLADRLRMSSGAPSATWTPVGKMHVTLKFAAALPLAAVAPLGKALGAMVEGHDAPAACSLRLEGFPSKEKAEIVVAELADESGHLAKLAARVEKLVAKYKVPAETRAYRPHVTLARLRLEYDGRRWLRSELAEVAGDCRAGGLTLYRSIPGSEGSTYVPLARFLYSTSTHTS